MKGLFKIIGTGSLLCLSLIVRSQIQKNTYQWDLKQCIDYAVQNNIQVKQAELAIGNYQASYEQAKAERLPNLNAQLSQDFTNGKSFSQKTNNYEPNNYFSGNYSVGSTLILYNGNSITNNIKQQDLGIESADLSVKESQNNIRIAVTQEYLQVLYAKESVKQDEQTLQGSEIQMEWAKNLYDAGSLSQADYAGIQSQYSSDKYNLTVGKNTLDQQILQLKQLLELGISDELDPVFPEVSDSAVYQVIPNEDTIYETSLKVMPEIANGEVNIDIAKLGYKLAKANFLPVLSLGMNLASVYNSSSSDYYISQLDNSFYQNGGFQLTIPIYSRRQNKTTLEKSSINIDNAKLELVTAKKNLLQAVETAYQNALNARSRFEASLEQLNASKLSYDLVEEQFNLGLKNTVDLTTEKNKYLSAQQEYLQAKYSALLNYKLLDFYQGKEISL
jgi:outer membrane protein